MGENRRVRVAIVGVGNCAASLVQGVQYYRDADPATRVPVVLHALHERRGTVADAGDGHPDLVRAHGRFAGHCSPGFLGVGSLDVGSLGFDRLWSDPLGSGSSRGRSWAARSCWINSLSHRTSRSLASRPSWCSSRV